MMMKKMNVLENIKTLAELGLSYIHVPTCGLLIFDFDVSLWSQVSVGKFNHYFPKSFR